MVKIGVLRQIPLQGHIAAISCGIYRDMAILDLDYSEDSNAQADSNFVLTEKHDIVEIQATAEEKPFSEAYFKEMLALAKKGVSELILLQKRALEI